MPEETPSPRWRRLVIGFAWALAALFLVSLSLWLYGSLIFADRLEDRVHAIQQAGEPINIMEAVPAPIPAARNAAPLYLSVFQVTLEPGGSRQQDLLGLTKSEEEELYDLYRKRDRRLLPRARRLLARPPVRSGLGTLSQAAQRPQAVFPVRWEAGYSATLPHLASFRATTRVVLVQALVSAAGGDGAAAAEWLWIALRLGNHCGQDPTMVAQLVSYAIYGMTAETAGHVAALTTLPPNAIRLLQAELADVDFAARHRTALLTERAFGLELLQQAERDPGKLAAAAGSQHTGALLAPALAFLSRTIVGRPFWQMQQWLFLGHMNEALQRAAQPYRATAGTPDLPSRQPWDISSTLVPAWGRVSRQRDLCLARVGLMQTALVLERVRAATGAYPASLDRLTSGCAPATPTDPFSGQSFVYRPSATGFMLYSVGPDLEDNGGQPLDKAWAGDVCWR